MKFQSNYILFLFSLQSQTVTPEMKISIRVFKKNFKSINFNDNIRLSSNLTPHSWCKIFLTNK